MYIRANTDYYTRLTWLQSNGSQYTNTHLQCNQDSAITLEYYSYMSPFDIPIISDCASDGSSIVSIFRNEVGSTSHFGSGSAKMPKMLGYENMTVDRDFLDVSGYKVAFSEVEDFTSGELYLFSNPVLKRPNYYTRIYNATFTIDGVLHEIIPVLDENRVPCMYNKTTREFLYNEGDDEFVFDINA